MFNIIIFVFLIFNVILNSVLLLTKARNSNLYFKVGIYGLFTTISLILNFIFYLQNNFDLKNFNYSFKVILIIINIINIYNLFSIWEILVNQIKKHNYKIFIIFLLLINLLVNLNDSYNYYPLNNTFIIAIVNTSLYLIIALLFYNFRQTYSNSLRFIPYLTFLLALVSLLQYFSINTLLDQTSLLFLKYLIDLLIIYIFVNDFKKSYFYIVKN